MRQKKNIRDYLALLVFVAGMILCLSSQQSPRNPSDTGQAARKMERVLGRKVAVMESYALSALSQDVRGWMDLQDLPDDIVVYRYCADTLQSWCNEFPVFNDDIKVNPYSSAFINARRNSFSPLSEASSSLSYMSMGPAWFLVKMWQEGDVKVIAGIDLTSYAQDGQYALRELSESCGTAVILEGKPVFKLVCETLSLPKETNAGIFWISVLLMLSAAVLYLYMKRTMARYRMSSLSILAGMMLTYLWGMSAGVQMEIFSPVLYAGNRVLYSFGAIIIVNITILMQSICLYMVRDRVDRRFRPVIGAAIFIIVAYTVLSIRNIIINSDITLELYRLEGITKYSFIAYLSYISMLVSVPMLLQVMGMDAFSRSRRIIFPVLIAGCMMSAVGYLGFRKEQNRLGVVANRLAFDRDIALERRLKMIEPQIAGDMIFASLAMFPNTEASIQSRLTDNYFLRSAQDYLVDVYVLNDDNGTPQALEMYSSILRNGSPIADNSHFLYVRDGNTHSYYAGIFVYYLEGAGVARVIMRLESKDTRGNKGYAGIFNITPQGKTVAPAGYSYAHYIGDKLISFKGSYAYPTRMDESLYTQTYINRIPALQRSGYTHFVTRTGQNEVVVLSRARIPLFRYFVMGIFVALLVFFLMSLMVVSRREERRFNIHNYRYRISAVLLGSLTLTLLVMAVVSVYFVYTRNEDNLMNVMSYKINSISNMVDSGLAAHSKNADITMQEFREIMDRAGDETNSDITLYDASGRFRLSTSQILFRRQLISGRISGTAYDNIVYANRRYYLQKERKENKTFYCMYAPVFDTNGSLMAILCSPYYDENYDFQKDAAAHSLTIISLFALLLMAARFLVAGLVDRLFKPLSEMSQKMSNADIDNLEQIEYSSDDEIRSIVQAYNRMVTELSDSTRKLAQAERDKAWSGMARQVAHEIKNPLTPMKLQLQRIIRLKQRQDPAWQERFDEASKVILDHIDILTDTANEFSTFAKLYSEEHTTFRLDTLLQDEIAMFNNRDNIAFDYIGLDNVLIDGPKPQITRVFVNLISNAVQAIESQEQGRIVVSLRNSVEDGFYDVLVEDNGSGVSEENLERLFTPNFTTKNGGSGLGLAISRSILETCGATISYSRSFTLGGACFTVRYPKDITSDGSRSEQDNP